MNHLKKLIIVCFVFVVSLEMADANQKLFEGKWHSTCTPEKVTTAGGKDLYTISVYRFEKPDRYVYTREWYSNPICTSMSGGEHFYGTFKIGKESTNKMIPKGAKDLTLISHVSTIPLEGFIWFGDDAKKLQILRIDPELKIQTRINLIRGELSEKWTHHGNE